MNEVILKQRLELAAGSRVSGLSDDQVRRRRHALRSLGNGLYEALMPIQFKAGERLVAAVPSSFAHVVEAPAVTEVPVEAVPVAKVAVRGRRRRP